MAEIKKPKNQMSAALATSLMVTLRENIALLASEPVLSRSEEAEERLNDLVRELYRLQVYTLAAAKREAANG